MNFTHYPKMLSMIKPYQFVNFLLSRVASQHDFTRGLGGLIKLVVKVHANFLNSVDDINKF